ncbi:hypothetical protein [Mitsuokella sp. oral taxon 131]|uniref:hypothetical protein n=1 Tax=Mitsuokella sp. oral taxon 131 TaxID=1321780 RepID=UPI000402F354|nr:hypothetical protein [Mitsuokella sp. oral taxon 131]
MKQYVEKILLLAGVLLCCLAIFNYCMDEYGIFHGNYSEPKSAVPQHFVKIRYLLAHPKRYDAFCFGSSRVESLDLSRIDNGLTYYNMTYTEGLPQEWLEDLRLLLAHGVTIKQVLIGLDDISYISDPRAYKSNLFRAHYEQYNWKTYLAFLTVRPFAFHASEQKIMYDVYGTGRTFHHQTEQLIEEDPDKHIHDPKFMESSHQTGDRVDATISEIRTIKQLTEEHGIDLIVFINPTHKTTYLALDRGEFNEFKRQLAHVTGYYDFSGLNEITENNYNYYDTAHYRPLVGDMMIDRMFRTGTPPQDFGVWVTEDNVEKHIRALESQDDSQ